MFLSWIDEKLDWVTLLKHPVDDEQTPPIPKLVVSRREFFTLDGAVNIEYDLVKKKVSSSTKNASFIVQICP